MAGRYRGRMRDFDDEDDAKKDTDSEPEPPKISKSWRTMGIVSSLLASLSLGAAVVDFFITFFLYCTSNFSACNMAMLNATTYTLTWVSAGVWGSLPAFLSAIFAIQRSKAMDNEAKTKRFVYVSVVTLVPVLPGMITVVTLEAYYMTTSPSSIDTWLTNLLTNIQYGLKFPLAVVVCVLGLVNFIVIGLLVLRYYREVPEELEAELEEVEEELEKYEKPMPRPQPAAYPPMYPMYPMMYPVYRPWPRPVRRPLATPPLPPAPRPPYPYYGRRSPWPFAARRYNPYYLRRGYNPYSRPGFDYKPAYAHGYRY